MHYNPYRDKGKQPLETPLRTLDFNENELDDRTTDLNDDIGKIL